MIASFVRPWCCHQNPLLEAWRAPQGLCFHLVIMTEEKYVKIKVVSWILFRGIIWWGHDTVEGKRWGEIPFFLPTILMKSTIVMVPRRAPLKPCLFQESLPGTSTRHSTMTRQKARVERSTQFWSFALMRYQICTKLASCAQCRKEHIWFSWIGYVIHLAENVFYLTKWLCNVHNSEVVPKELTS
jgi:hypothetical protein